MTEFQFLGDGLIARNIGFMEVVQQPTALTDHHEQATARAVVLVIALKVSGKVIDALGEQRNLHVGGTGVLLVQLELLDGFGFGFHTRQFRQI